MTTLAQVLFNAGPDGATITTANAGVDGVFGTAPTYTADAIEGAFAAQFNGAGAGNSNVQKAFAADQPDAFASYYFRMPATVPAAFNTLTLADNANNTVCAARVNTDLSITLRDGATARGSTGSIPAGAWVRLELKGTPGSGAATACQLRVFYGSNVHGSTPDFTLAGVNSATAATAVRKVNAGCVTAGPTHVGDRLIVDDAAYPAPLAASPPTVNAGPDLTKEAGGPAFAISAVATPAAPATIVSRSWTQISGPTVGLAGASTDTVTVTPPASTGVVVLRYSATDSNGQTATDDVTVTVVAAGQVFRPVAVLAAGGWTATPAATPITDNIDEAALDTDDLIISATNPSAAVLRLRLESKPAPADGADAYVWLVADVTTGTATHSVQAKLYESDGTTLRKTWAAITDLPVNAPSERQLTLSPAEVASVTSWNSGLVLELVTTAA